MKFILIDYCLSVSFTPFLPFAFFFFPFSFFSLVEPTFLSIKNLSQCTSQKHKASSRYCHSAHERTAVVALVLRLAPPRLAADLPSPQVLRDDGAVRVNRFDL